MRSTAGRSPKNATTIAWRSPELNLWVATSNGEYAGMVEFVDGHFVARGRTGDVVEHFSSIPAAQQAVAESAGGEVQQVRMPRSLTARPSRGIRRGATAHQDAA